MKRSKGIPKTKEKIIEEINKTDEEAKAEVTDQEIKEKIKQIKTMQKTFRNNGKPFNEELYRKKEEKLTPVILFIFVLIFIFSGLSVITKIYKVLQN